MPSTRRSSPAYQVPAPRRSRDDQQRARRRQRHRRTRIIFAILLIPLVAVGAELVRRGITAPAARPVSAAPSSEAPSPTPSAEPTPSPTPSASPTPLYAVPISYPKSGPGTWGYAMTQGPVLGTAGTLRRFRIAIESGVESLGYGTDIASFADFVDAALGDPRSWIGGRQVRFQRVPNGANYQFTIYLATGETAYRLCLAGGVNIRIGGAPYSSCRATGKVIINLNRWMSSTSEMVSKQVPLDLYRRYVVNHEVGHELGNGHERCPGAGQLAPVMQQQTLGLKGCTVNPWPYLNGRRYRGPSA
ncbi:MAG TPA: DUF3152 domain-containing protein [Micromonosporaceae bacterium]|nr:DUF3152 domain-containing protein [Micromonosporaceae bacterium]